MEAIEQLLDVGFGVEVDEAEGMAVAGEELADPQRAAAVIGAEQHRVAEPVRDQLDAAEDERAHQDVAQLASRSARAT